MVSASVHPRRIMVTPQATQGARLYGVRAMGDALMPEILASETAASNRPFGADRPESIPPLRALTEARAI
jgi:hypothetical protein